MFQTFLVIVCESFCFLLCLLFFAWCYHSLLNVATLIVIFCSMLLFFCCPLLDVLCLTPLLHARQHCSSYSTFFNIVAPLIIPYFTFSLLLLLFIWWCCPLLDTATPLTAPFTIPCSMMLLLLLLLVWHYSSSITPCSTLLLLLLLLGCRSFSMFLGQCCYSFIRSSSTWLAQIPLYYVVMFLLFSSFFNATIPTPHVLDWYFPH